MPLNGLDQSAGKHLNVPKIKIDKADKVFSQYIRLRDGFCKRCKSKVQVNSKGLPITHQASHFKGRGKEATRFDPENVDCLCSGCHFYFTGQPDEHYLWQIETKGQAAVDAIILRANGYKKKNRQAEYELWKTKLQKLLQ